MLALAMFLVAVAAPPTTDEKFAVTAEELNGPCVVKVEGKPVEEPPLPCAAAIVAAATPKEKAILYFAWAYSLNEAGAALQALPNLDKSVALAPNFTNARHERSFTLSELGFYDRALIDSNRDVALSPQSARAYQERAFARHRLADLEGSLADHLKEIELGGPSHGAEIAIVRDLMWLGRYDEAAKRLAALPETEEDKPLRSDLDRRRHFKPDGKEARRCQLTETVEDRGSAQKMVDDCTWAFDHETDRAKRAEFLSTRAAYSVVASQNSNAGFSDLLIAAVLDPKNPDRHTNLGFALLSARHSWAARNEFDIALATSNLSRRGKTMALAGRGQARANLGDAAGAFVDAKASFEIEPLEPGVWLLGDLAFANGDKEGAKVFWMGVYHMGVRDDSLLASLKSVGVDDPAKEPR
jgi:tetratricopeptide (TPR) repeat protein